MKLIYRAQTFFRNPRAIQPYQKPRALNWRFQAPNESYGDPRSTLAYTLPRALNWRFQMAARITL